MTWTAPEPFPRPTKEKRAIGSSRPANEPRTPIKKESKKQHKRKGQLRTMKEVILAKMHEVFGYEDCMARGAFGLTCSGRLDLDHVNPAGRHEEGRDSFENFQLICRVHHTHKTVTPGLYAHDYRSEYQKKLLRECRF